MTRKPFNHFCFMILFTVFGSLFGQAAEPSQAIPNFKRWSLIFHMNEKFNWTRTNGNLISGQYFIKPDLGIRMGISGNFQYNSANTDGSTHSEARQSRYTAPLNIYTTILFYNRNTPIRFYWGFGPVFGRESAEIKSELRGDDGQWEETSNRETTALQFGAHCVAGVEWRYKDYLFLFLEYNPKFIFRYQETEDLHSDNFQAKTYKIDSSPIGLGIGILF